MAEGGGAQSVQRGLARVLTITVGVLGVVGLYLAAKVDYPAELTIWLAVLGGSLVALLALIGWKRAGLFRRIAIFVLAASVLAAALAIVLINPLDKQPLDPTATAVDRILACRQSHPAPQDPAADNNAWPSCTWPPILGSDSHGFALVRSKVTLRPDADNSASDFKAFIFTSSCSKLQMLFRYESGMAVFAEGPMDYGMGQIVSMKGEPAAYPRWLTDFEQGKDLVVVVGAHWHPAEVTCV